MEHGPLPPHERTWRHPSELAAQEHALARAEPTPATTRMFAITTGTLGLLAIGMLVLAVTPNRTGSPVAIEAITTSPAITGEPATSALMAVTESSVRTPVALRGRPEALATPIGTGRFAVVTAADLTAVAGAAGVGDAVEVEVPSGRMHDARVVVRVGDTVLVELEQNEPGVDLADGRPDGHEMVTVLAEPPVTIVLDDLPRLTVEEGTAVLDGDGDLVGLCSTGDDEATQLLVVSGEMLDHETVNDGDGGGDGAGLGDGDGAGLRDGDGDGDGAGLRDGDGDGAGVGEAPASTRRSASRQ